MIRRNKTMLVRHEFGIAVPLIFTARKDIRREIKKERRQRRVQIGEMRPRNFPG